MSMPGCVPDRQDDGGGGGNFRRLLAAATRLLHHGQSAPGDHRLRLGATCLPDHLLARHEQLDVQSDHLLLDEREVARNIYFLFCSIFVSHFRPPVHVTRDRFIAHPSLCPLNPASRGMCSIQLNCRSVSDANSLIPAKSRHETTLTSKRNV